MTEQIAHSTKRADPRSWPADPIVIAVTEDSGRETFAHIELAERCPECEGFGRYADREAERFRDCPNEECIEGLILTPAGEEFGRWQRMAARAAAR